MHPSALLNAKYFFENYTDPKRPSTVVDIGAQNVNGSLKDVAPPHLKYIGVDFVQAEGVDVVLTDPYILPFETDSIDIVVSSSCLEHSEMFWVLFLEILRILRPDGLFYLNVPTNGHFHRYPVDCWRFYPDSGQALVNWARRSGLRPCCLESYVSDKQMSIWNDYVAVFVKDQAFAAMYPNRIVNQITTYTNGSVLGAKELLQPRTAPDDQYNILNALKCRYWIWKEKGFFYFFSALRRKISHLRKTK